MRFRNPDPRHRRHGMWSVFRWSVLDRLTGRRKTAAPGPPAPWAEPDLELIRATDAAPRLTWLGHASFLWQVSGVNVLVDPVFAGRIGWFYQRHLPPGLTPDQLPSIDLLLISHNHYDHLDFPSIEAVPRSATVVTTHGLGRHFVKRMFARVIELDWWDTVEVGRVNVTLTPARHWSRRSPFDGNRTLWGGFVVEERERQNAGRISNPSTWEHGTEHSYTSSTASDTTPAGTTGNPSGHAARVLAAGAHDAAPGRRQDGRIGNPSCSRDTTDGMEFRPTVLYYAGDSAWFDGFAEVGRRFPHIDLALIPIGGYEPAWFMENHHLNPEQAGRAFLDCGARRMAPMHWGTFQMTDEPLSAPIERLRRWWDAAAVPEGRELLTPAVGETLRLVDVPCRTAVVTP